MTFIETPRLRLRPWRNADAPALFELARDPRIGMLCGWKPFERIDDAHEALSTVLAAPDSYAVTLASTGELVGSIALRIDTGSPEASVADIGYWIGAPLLGQGIRDGGWGRHHRPRAGAGRQDDRPEVLRRKQRLATRLRKARLCVAKPRGGRGIPSHWQAPHRPPDGACALRTLTASVS